MAALMSKPYERYGPAGARSTETTKWDRAPARLRKLHKSGKERCGKNILFNLIKVNGLKNGAA